MSKHTFTPGARVRVFPSGEKGTVVDSPELSRQFPQFVPVSFDGTGTSRPCSPENLIALGHEQAAGITAADFLHAHPELTTEQTTVTDLIRAAHAAGFRPSALIKALGIVTGATK